ncbi:MAG: amidase [Candidatus Sigynarchaeum springense]
MARDGLCWLPATELLERIRRGDGTWEEVAESIIARMERVNPVINAYCTTTLDMARAQARAADNRIKAGEKKLPILDGVPTSIKDMFDIPGVRTTWGSRIMETNVPTAFDAATERLHAAGCAFLGKTNMCEFGALGVTKNKIFGETKNPWHLGRTCGGSSGGAGAAVAAGLGQLALGADGGGSIRHPAALCGIVGFKPTFGRVPFWPSIGMAGDSATHVGPITRAVKDAALMMDALKGPHIMDRYSIPDDGKSYLAGVDDLPKRLKIAWTLDLGYTKAIDPEIEKAIANGVEKFRQFGWEVEPARVKVKNIEPAFYTIYTSLFAFDLKPKLKDWADKMDPDVVKMVSGEWTPANDFIRAMDQRRKFHDAMLACFKDFDLLATPTVASTAFELGTMFPAKIAGKNVSPTGWMPYTFPFNLTGQPAITVPCGFSSEGLPIGLQLVGKKFDDLLVLQAARAFEIAAPWADKRPAL